MLTLPEQLMLIALKDEKGTVLFTASGILHFSIIGAIMMELYFAKKIDYENKKIIVTDNTPTGNAFFDNVLQIISDSGNTKDIKYWLLKINSKIKNVKERTIGHLVFSKVLKEENHKIFGLFSKKTYPTINPEPEIKLRECIKNFVLNKEAPDERNIVLLSLSQISNLLEDIFNKDDIKTAKERISELVTRSHHGEAIREETSRLIQGITTGIADASGTGGPI